MKGITSMVQSLAHHCDKLLRKGQSDVRQNEQIDLEIIFQQIEVRYHFSFSYIIRFKILLRYMQEKDVFEKFYSKLLAKRLINQKSISSDYEKSMILTIQVRFNILMTRIMPLFSECLWLGICV